MRHSINVTERKSRDNSFKRFKLLFYATNVLGVTPIEQHKSSIMEIICKVYPIFLIILLISTYIYQLFGRTPQWKSQNLVPPVVTGSLASFVLYCINISITYTSHLQRIRKYELLQEKIFTVEQLISVYDIRNKTKNVFLIINILLMYCLLVSSVAIDVYLQLHVLPDYHYYLIENLYRIRLGVGGLHIWYVAYSIYVSLCGINAIMIGLSRKTANISRIKRTNHELILHGNMALTFKHLSKMYALLSESVDNFNALYGFSILYIFMYMIIFFLVIFDLSRMLPIFRDSYIYWFWTAACSLVVTIIPVSLANICSKITRESQKTAQLAYDLLYSLNLNRSFGNENLIMKNLLILLRQASSNSFKFSAAGFFPVNYSGLYIILNLVTSYSIVALQF